MCLRKEEREGREREGIRRREKERKREREGGSERGGRERERERGRERGGGKEGDNYLTCFTIMTT